MLITMPYDEQLRNPRWQARREAILKRDNHQCVKCRSTRRLRVHHLKYTGLAWEASDANLITLCAICHAKTHGKVDYGEFTISFKSYIRHVRLKAPEATNILLTLMWINDEQNVIYASYKQIAKEAGKTLPTISRHMKKLRELKVIVNDIRVPSGCYRIHPLIAWKGKAADRDKYIAGLGTDHPFSKLMVELNPEDQPSEPGEDDE